MVARQRVPPGTAKRRSLRRGEQATTRHAAGGAAAARSGIAHVSDYVHAGFNHLVLHGPGHDQERFLSQFSEDLLPRLRTLTPAVPHFAQA
jgi:hypothetical protein